MRFNSVRFVFLTSYLRAGTLTVLNSLDVRGVGYSRSTHLDPALIGQMIHDCARRTMQIKPYLAVPRAWMWEWRLERGERQLLALYKPGAAEAAGASSDGNLMRTAVRVDTTSDGFEARFMGFQPQSPSEETTGIGARDVLSPRSRSDEVEDYSAELHPLQIAPWWDPEMLGQAILMMLSKSGPPKNKGMSSVFDLPPAKRRSALHLAALDGDMAALPGGRRKLRRADAADTLGATPLMLSASRGQVEFASRLVELGASLDAQDNAGRGPLHYAAEKGRHRLAQMLVDSGADVAAVDQYGETSLHLAAARGHPDTVKLLLAAGAPLNAVDSVYLSTPLHKAVRGGHLEVAFALVEGGADVNAPNEGGRTPLHLAASYGLPEIVSFLIESGADVSRRDRRMETPLHLPAFYQHLECMRALVEHGSDVGARDINGNTPLHLAAGMNRDEAARLLLAAGAGVEEFNDEGMTAIDLAIANLHSTFFHYNLGRRYSSSAEHNTEVAQALLESGATIDPLRLPVGERHVLWPHLTPPQLLYDNGNINYYRLSNLPELFRSTMPPEEGPWQDSGRPISPNARRHTLLHDAVFKRAPEVVEALLGSGANPTTAVRNYCPTPLHCAADVGDEEIAALLLDGGAEINAPECNTLEGRLEMGNLGFSFENRGANERSRLHTALDVAISQGKTEVARLLLGRGGLPYVDIPTLLRLCPEDVRVEMESLLGEYGDVAPSI